MHPLRGADAEEVGWSRVDFDRMNEYSLSPRREVHPWVV